MSATKHPTKKSRRSCGLPGIRNYKSHTWRAEAEKQRRWAWEKACLAANMMVVFGCKKWVGLVEG